MARKKVALILGGGGARGAYQVGVLEAWRDVLSGNCSLEILIGVSAGSINAMRLMQHAPDLATGVDALKSLWSAITTDDIFDSGLRATGGNMFRLVRSSRHLQDLGRDGVANSLLKTDPMLAYLANHIDTQRVHQRLRELPDRALALNCFDYTEGRNVTFFETSEHRAMWERPGSQGVRSTLGLEHVMASCAVPLIFPPMRIDGHYYGDGSLRNHTPLQAAIHLGAERIINVSLSNGAVRGDIRTPTLGRIFSTLFDGMYMDALDVDNHFLDRINFLTAKVPERERETKIIELCRIEPLFDFNVIAERHRNRFPKSLRYLFGGWITPDMLSYLLFDGDYTRELMELGRKDGEAYRHKVEEWLQ